MPDAEDICATCFVDPLFQTNKSQNSSLLERLDEDEVDNPPKFLRVESDADLSFVLRNLLDLSCLSFLTTLAPPSKRLCRLPPALQAGSPRLKGAVEIFWGMNMRNNVSIDLRCTHGVR